MLNNVCNSQELQNLRPEHRQALLEMADEWRKIAEALDAKEGLFSHKRMDA